MVADAAAGGDHLAQNRSVSADPAGAHPTPADPGPSKSSLAFEADPAALEPVGIDQLEPPRAPAVRDAPPAQARPPAAPPQAAQIEVHLATAAQGRIERMVVQLEPVDLGRVEIKLEFADDGKVTALFAAERPETLEALQRDAAGLERTLREAGLRPDAGSLCFSLRREQGGGDGRPTVPLAPAAETTGQDEASGEQARPAHMMKLRLLDIQA